MAPQKAAIKILISDACGLVKFNKAKLRRMLAQLCRRFKVSRGVVSIAITDDAGIVAVNKRFLQSSKKTDVISFDLSEARQADRVFDMVVNSQRARREAKRRGHGDEAELVLYIVHGFLHCVGYDDLKITAARKMHAAEDEILQEFGYGITYQSGKE